MSNIIDEQINPIGALVRKQEMDYISNTPTYISKYVSFDLYENLNKIDAYINSKHISGETDSQGRPKPFFNIVRAARNIWFRATDIDRKDIVITATTQSDVIAAILATAKLREWMNVENFGQFLNDWGLNLATYGSTVIKFVNKGGELHKRVIPWSSLIIDPIDIDKAPVIEILELTEDELRQNKAYDQEMVEALCNARKARELLNKQKKDNRNNYIKLYEIHGKLPLAYLTGKDSDNDTYVQQMQVISFVASKQKGTFDDFTLVSGREAKSPYMITHLIKEDNRATGVGAVESLFENQWMVNHTAKAIKDQLDLASKLIFQTSDGNFVGQNAITAIENGDIMIHAVNAPLTQLQNNSHDITSLQNFGQQWKTLGNEIVGISESMLGNNPPSGTAWRQTEAILQENHSLFQLMTQNKGLSVEEMLRVYIIPFIKTQLSTTDEIKTTLNEYGIEKINAIHMDIEVARIQTKIAKDALLKGQTIDPAVLAQVPGHVQNAMAQNQPDVFISPDTIGDKTWADVFKDFEWDCQCNITGESQDKQAALATLNTTLQILLAKQGQPFTPEEKLVFGKILTLSGEVSPAEIEAISNPPAQPQPQTAPMAAPVATPFSA